MYKRSNGVSGGMLLMWDWRVVEKKEECLGRYFMAYSLQNMGDNFIWVFRGYMA
jgi:hypothetical protein